MKKTKLICLALAMVFVLSALFTACGKKDTEEATTDIIDKASVNTRHLTMWVVVEKPLSAETATAVTDALNDITMTKFSTKLAVYFLTEEEYRQTLTDTIRANEDARNPLLSDAVEETPVEEETTLGEVETVTNKYGLPEKKYDPLKPNQVDIIYIQGEDMYLEYIENGWLVALDSELSAASKKIKEYISGTLLNAVKYNNVTYAIPNNSMIGEYTYMLLDKELMEECSMDGVYNQGKIQGFFNQYIYNYLETVRAHYSGTCECHSETIAPIDASYEDISKLLAHYWSFDPDTYKAEEAAFSVLGYRYTNAKTLSRGQTVLSFNSLFADKVFCENFVKINEFRMDGGYYTDVNDTDRAAVKFCTGSLSDYEKLAEDYYPVIVKYPTANVEDVFENMFGVCTYSIEASRSMEIVTYLNTNADFRNILQYGVEGVHYEVEGEGAQKSIIRLNEDYLMDIFKTGNTFIAYPEPGMDADVWEVGKKQNREALIEPTLLLDISQLGKDAAQGNASQPTISSKGYEYTYITGYAKETVMENALLNKWITACDALGGGVYVYHTSKTDGQNVTGKIYYYNNNISGASVTVTDGDGSVSVNYSGTVGGGNEITVIDFYGKKNSSKLNWTATVNDAAVAAKVTYQNSIINFDFFETDHYDIAFTANMSQSKVFNNEVAWSVIKPIKDPKTADLQAQKKFVWTYKAESGEGESAKTIYTYFFYGYELKAHSVSVLPIMKDGVLTLNISYKNGEALAEEAPDYACFLITATVDANVTNVVFDLKVNGAAAENLTEATFETDPRYVLCGELNTELIKYIDKLNADVWAMIEACEDKTELAAVVADLNVLFTTQKYPFNMDMGGIYDVPGNLKSDKVMDYVNNVLENDMESFYWNLHIATSKDDVVKLSENYETGKTEEITTNAYTSEAYYYFKTPYALYYAWLKSNGLVTK